MRFARINKSIILFIAISIAIHLCLFGMLWLERSFGLPNANPFRIKIALNSASDQKGNGQNTGDKLSAEKPNEQINAKEQNSNKSLPSRYEEPPPQRSNGWSATKGPLQNYANSISERSALESRLNAERQQRQNTIFGSVAQLMGRLNQEGVTVGCALWINQSAQKGFLKCSPENMAEQIKFYLAPANIEWVNQANLQPPAMCIPIQIRNAHAAC